MPRVTNNEAAHIGHTRALAEGRNQCYADALLLTQQKNLHLRRGDVDASAALAENLDDLFVRALALSETIVRAYVAPKTPACDRAFINVLFPLEEQARGLLDEIGIEQAEHTRLLAALNARLCGPPAPRGREEDATA
jgi:hypothetical protein